MPQRSTLEIRDSRKFAAAFEAALQRGLKVRFRVHGQSMQPNVLDGDIVVATAVAPGGLLRGDIALVRGASGFLLHRVMGWDSITHQIVTRGDAGQQNDRPAESVLGKVVSIERAGKKTSLAMPGTKLLHAFRRQLRRVLRSSVRRLRGAALVPSLFILVALLLHAAPAMAQANLTLTDAAAPNPVATGANITYTETVTNNSGAAATGATLTQDTPPNTLFQSVMPPTGWTCGTAPAVGGTGAITCTAAGDFDTGTSASFTVEVEVRPEAPGGSTITNSVTVSWTGPNPGGDNTATASVQVGGADLSMTQVASAAAVAPGETITYTETVTNNGPNAAVGAVLYQQTPPNTTFYSVTPPADWTCGTAPAVGGTGQVICTDGTSLDANTTGNFTFVVEVNSGTAAGTTVLNSADVTSQTTDPVSSNNATTTSVLVENNAGSDLAVSTTASPTPVFVSSPIAYTIQITNLGLAPASNVTLTDTLPASLVGASATTTQGSCGAPVPGPPSTITCTIGTVAYPLAAPITITLTGTTSGTALTMTNVAAVTASSTDPVSGNNSVTVLTVVQPLVCATPGNDGAGGALSGVVNAYYPPGSGVGTVNAGSTSIVLGAAAASPGAQTAIAVGDLLLIIQMQDAQINSTNTSSYGSGVPGDPAGSTGLGSSGEFEFVTATSAVPVTGGSLSFTGTGVGGGLLNTYTSAAATATQGIQTFQVVRVPQYTTATLSSGLTAPAWNGATGGVLALDIASQLTLGGTVATDGLGFRGGGGIDLKGSATGANTDTMTASPATLPALPPPSGSGANGSKGESIAGTPHYVAPALATITHATTAISTNQTYLEGFPNGSFARGAPGNGGGGATDADPSANDQNDGGGGGSNGGTGGTGGFAWNSAGISGGFGGAPFPVTTSALVMGGGGGAGTSNDGAYWDPSTDTGDADCGTNCTGIYSSGAAGGGIVIVRAGSVTGSGTITANGQTALDQENDGTGGGGAGGTILVFANSGGLAGLTANATGGQGGNTWPEQTPGTTFPGNRHGPGGGGGGGVILSSSTPTGVNVSGGAPGTSTLADDPYGATAGQPGLFTPGLSITETPGTQSGAYCAGADLAVTNSGTPSPVVPGNNITYTQTATNNGGSDAVNAVFTEAVPVNTTFQSLLATGPGAAGWTCSDPAVNGTGNINCTNPDVPVGASGATTFTVVVQVNSGTTTGTQIADTDSITSGTNDPNLSNNTAMVLTIVGAATTSDLSVTNTATPNPVQAGNNITYTVVVASNGPSAASTVAFTETIPANTTLVSATATSGTSGWTCAVGSISCTIPTFAVGSSTTFTVIVNVNAATASGTVISDTATLSSTTTDSDPSNNVAIATVVVATSGQADLAVGMTGTPNPVLAGNNITYSILVSNNGPANVPGTVTLTDTLPPSTSVVTIAGPGSWTCPAASGGVQTCTIGSLAANATATFALILKVAAGTAPGPPPLTNTVTVSSATSDPNTANNTAVVKTTVTSPTQADVAIIKTASPEPVDQGTNLTYTLQVTNNGPAVAQNVVVSDPLPGEVTFTSSSTTQGSCTGTTTVTCDLGSMSVGGLVVVTINVNAATFSSATLSSNTATVSSTTSDPNLTNNTSTAISTIQSPTAVQIASFQAQSLPGGGVVLEWHTREETRNLGFHIYREDAQGRHRLDPSLIAGSALFLRGGQPQHRAKSYQWVDSQGGPQASYWLEDLDLNGTHTLHGPISVGSVSDSPAPASQARLLSQLNQAIARPAAQLTRLLLTPNPLIPTVPPGESPTTLNEVPAVKISVTTEGWYQVSRAQLVAAGLNAFGDSRMLQLYAEGIEQPLLILGKQSGPLGPNDSIEFYGTGIDTPFSGTRVYWLVQGSRPGKRISSVSSGGSGNSVDPSFPFTVLLEQRTIYFAALLNGENNDNFFGATVTSDPVEQDLTVAHIDPNSALPVTLNVTLQGVTDAQEHRVSVAFNGAPIGEVDFTNQANVTNTLNVTSGLLQEGTNAVTLTALEGDNDVSLVQSIAIQYAHTYTVDSNWLRATASSGDTVRFNGFTNAQIHVLDITDPLAITQLTGPVALTGSNYGVTLTIPGPRGSPRTFLAFSEDQTSAPAALSFHHPDYIDRPKGGASLIVITHPDFESSITPLVNLHESEGTSVAVVTTDEIFDAFNFGERSPFAILDYLQLAATSWSEPPQAVLLVGDASFDPRNYLGFGDFDFVPSRMIETAAFKTASDDWLTDFKQTGFATIPTGRLPVRTPADAALVVSKIVGYERAAVSGSWRQQALVIADQNVGVDFTSSANIAAADMPKSLAVTKILADGQDPAVVQPQILAALNGGSLLVNYIGHGSEEQWSFSDLFDDTAAASLTNGDRLSVYLLMDCLNGFFQDVYATSLSTALMLAPNGGAVAVWASSGFTDAAPQATMNQALLSGWAANPSLPIGKAILDSKAGIADPDVRRTWNLFGDPTMQLPFPAAKPPSRKR